MKRFLTFCLLALFIHQTLQAQCEELRYRYPIFDEVEVISDIHYGQNTLYSDNIQELLLDVYLPAGDTATIRPLVIMAHGGYFISGSKTDNTVVPICEGLARMGYVTASIGYRLGVPIEFPLAGPFTEAVLRGIQDMRAAIRFFRKSFAEDGNPYGIHPDEIYVGGLSAGGILALHLAYMDLDEVPATVNWNNPGLTGGIEGNSGNPGYSSDIKAVIGIAAAIGDIQWIETGDVPAFLAHGTHDDVVPFGSAMLTLFGAFDVVEVDGSSSIQERLDDLEIENCFEIYYGQGHVPSQNIELYFDTTLSIMSNFLAHMICPQIPLDCEYREMTLTTEEIVEAENSYVYPNPAHGVAYLRDAQTRFIRMRDLTGKEVEVKDMNQTFYLNELARGIYLVELEKQGKIMIQKLVVY